MKKQLSILAFMMLSSWAFCQENSITLSGGYAFTNIEDSDIKATGWRINGLFEFTPLEGQLSHGLSIGYVSVSGDNQAVLGNTTYDIGSLPIYYAPKFLFGKDSFKAFLKGAIGMQFSSFKRTGFLGSLSDNDFGFAGGGGAGFVYYINENVFMNAEYELLWLSNAYYKDGLLNTASVGVGIKF